MFSLAFSTNLNLSLALTFDRVIDLIGHALDEMGNERNIKPWAAFFHSCWTTLSAVFSDLSGSRGGRYRFVLHSLRPPVSRGPLPSLPIEGKHARIYRQGQSRPILKQQSIN